MRRALPLFALLGLLSKQANAEPLPPDAAQGGSAGAPSSVIALYAPSCVEGPLDAARLLELLRVELGAIGVSDVRAGGSPVPGRAPRSDLLAAVIVSWQGCDAAARDVTMEVVDRATSKTVQRRMTISDVPYDDRPRALAIAIAELLQASWAELELVPRATTGVDVPPELRASIVQRLGPQAALPRALPLPITAPLPGVPPVTPVENGAPPTLSASAILRAFPSRDTALLGPELSLSVPFAKFLALGFAADVGFGDSQVAAGSIHTTATFASAGIAAVAGSTTRIEIGPRFSAGYAWASGTPGDAITAHGRSYSHFVALAVLSATLHLPAHGWSALIGLDAGAAISEASFLVDTARAAGIGGIAFGARLGAGLGI